MILTRLTREFIKRSRFIGTRRLSSLAPAVTHLSSIHGFRGDRRSFSAFSKSPDYSEVPLMDLLTFESLCSETLESLTDYFEVLVETDQRLKSADIEYSVSFKFQRVISVKLPVTL